MTRIRHKLRSKSFWSRAGWLSLAGLFILTALGIGLLSFWQSTHNSNDTTQTPQVVCQISSIPATETLPAPEAYKPSADVTALEATDLKEGIGDAVKAGDCLQVKYYGSLASDGTMFDENYTQQTALKFQVGVGQVIPGWDQGLIGMKAGGERRLVIPSELGYGSTGNGSIPANADLVFFVKLLQIVK